ncbi:MAG: hypothetical protein PHR21_07895 [Oscillospiraceae bacterium]|nr:hypothetical protein [Oscillospiraceae bacterium]MDD4369143.1 hypothetical protein [Oscillospiraceae bacterium]
MRQVQQTNHSQAENVPEHKSGQFSRSGLPPVWDALVRVAFYILFTISYLGALTHSYLRLGDNAATGMSTTLFSTGLVILLLLILTVFFVGVHLRQRFWAGVRRHAFLGAAVLFILAACFQVLLILKVHPGIGWDVDAIHMAVIDPQDPDLETYFSMYPNNVLILLLQHKLADWFQTQSWLFFDLLTLVLVDLSVWLNVAVIGILKPQLTAVALALQSLFLLVFPYIMVPYTDAWVLPLVSLYLLGYCLVKQPRFMVPVRGLGLILFGFGSVATYYMKPSAIIPLIAIGMNEAWRLLRRLIKQRGRFPLRRLGAAALTGLAIGVAFALPAKLLGQAVNQQSYIEVDPDLAIPAVHYLSMGVSGTGGYNAADALKMAELQTVEERVQYSLETWKQRLQDKGVLGYLSFLLQKQVSNTADGSLAWLKEGSFMQGVEEPTYGGLTGLLQSFLYLYGNHVQDFRFAAQLFWVFLLSLIFWACKERDFWIQTLRLSLLGGFLFLLLFEGGRSRYMIQFLPVLLLLAVLSAPASFRQLRSIWVAVKPDSGWSGRRSESEPPAVSPKPDPPLSD